MLGVRLDDNLEKKLARYARKMGQTKSQCAKKALEEYLNKRSDEEVHDKQTLAGLRQIEGGEGIPVGQVFDYLDSWGNQGEI